MISKSYSSKIRISLLLAILSCVSLVFAQKNQFLAINSTTGFENDYIYDVSQDSMGYMWFATGAGLIKLDDHKSTLIPTDDQKEEHLLYTVDIGKKSLWLGGKNGYMANYTAIKTHKIKSPFSQRILNIHQLDSVKTLFVSENEGAYIYDTKKDTGTYLNKDTLGVSKILSTSKVKDKWFFCTRKGLSVFEYQNGSFTKVQEYKELKKINAFLFLDDNTMLAGTGRKGLKIIKFKNEKIDTIFDHLNVEIGLKTPVKHILRDEGNSFWVSTFGEGIVEIKFNEDYTLEEYKKYGTETGLETNYINKTFQDYEGNLWVCTYGKGVLYKARDYVRLVPFQFDQADITSVKKFKNGIIFSAKNQVYFSKNEQDLELLFSESSEDDFIKKLAVFSENEILYSVDEKGLFIYDLIKKKSRKIEYSNTKLSDNINDILITSEKEIWLATYNGVHKTNLKGESLLHFTTQSGLRHNLCNSLAQKPDGSILVGSKSNRLIIIDNKSLSELKIPGINPSMTISHITVKENGNIWLSTLGSGIFQIKKDTILNFHKNNGLQDNFVFNTVPISNDFLLVVHERALGKINTNNYALENFSNKYGIASKYIQNSICKTENNIYWGATGGLIVFNPQKYFSKSIKPKVGFTKLYINDSVINELGKQRIELPYGKYKVMLDYKGVSFSNSENVIYSYFLDGYDDEWHHGKPLDLAIYKNIGSGTYTFKIKACLNEICEERTADFTLYIDKPLWVKAWFLALLALVILSLLLGAFSLQAQANKRKKRILEYNIELKTKELKLKNEHIISSITYAKRIQDAVMPNKSVLDNNKYDFFTIEFPKDIVGGDFIWQNKQDKKLFVTLCDCTGHGVPGGFMTILSANLLGNTIAEKKIHEPNKVLEHLNRKVLDQLHDSNENEVHDGMDMSLVVIDEEAQTLSYCGANRPFFVLTKSKGLQYLKGTRKSIGDDSRQSPYEVINFDLDDVESFYLYSDGFVDQFGGDKQQKFGRKNLMACIEKIMLLDAQTQKEELTRTIVEWKSTHDFQLDDISFLGFVKK